MTVETDRIAGYDKRKTIGCQRRGNIALNAKHTD